MVSKHTTDAIKRLSAKSLADVIEVTKDDAPEIALVAAAEITERVERARKVACAEYMAETPVGHALEESETD